ncbi:MAG: Co2+/Mg2+ efflux protein ApaG [Phycisphaerales bacterium]
MPARTSSETVTSGVRVRALPMYLPAESDPDARRFVFGYRIRITNESEQQVKLLSRYWLIVDANGAEATVRGEGVVGQQPELGPGESFEYSSYCPLTTPWGTMEGKYTMVHLFDGPKESRGPVFEIDIARFYLVSQPAERPTA